jgi:hypothetical protein
MIKTDTSHKNEFLSLTENKFEAKSIEELKLIDSDKDGLSDYEELFIYFTDVLNTDTDGDGYSDKEEIDSGFDPLSIQ